MKIKIKDNDFDKILLALHHKKESDMLVFGNVYFELLYNEGDSLSGVNIVTEKMLK